jgi:hypothetical protein
MTTRCLICGDEMEPTGCEAVHQTRPLDGKPMNQLRTLDTWHEDDGPSLWWKLPVEEAPYVGTPLDGDFPDYVTHWTVLQIPVV